MKYKVVLTIEVPDGVSSDSKTGIIDLCWAAFEALTYATGIKPDLTLNDCILIKSEEK
jgi:hypothetical protein